MTGYRLFLMRDGHIQRAQVLHAEGDAAAIEQAERLRDARPAELWTRARLVMTFPAATPGRRSEAR